MNSWSYRRKLFISILFFLFLVILFSFPVYFFLHRTPTCSDGKQNGTERGVDCGGACQRVCKSEALPILKRGDPQVFELATSTYAVALEVDNPNVESEVYRAPYTLSLYEEGSSTPVKVINDSTFVPKNSNFALFIGPINLESHPTRAVFVWAEDNLNWQKDASPSPNLRVNNIILDKNNSRLTAEIQNQTLSKVANIEVVALIFDESGNIVRASKTFVDTLDGEGKEPVVFTWPTALSASTTVKILPRVLPDQSFL